MLYFGALTNAGGGYLGGLMSSPTTIAPSSPLSALEAALAALAAEREQVAELTRERDHLRASHERLRLELELLRRRIFIAKAERVDTRQLEMEFAADPRRAQPARRDDAGRASAAGRPGGRGDARRQTKPTGRRDLRETPARGGAGRDRRPALREAGRRGQGRAPRLRGELQARLQARRLSAPGRRPGEVPRPGQDGESHIETAPMPPGVLPALAGGAFGAGPRGDRQATRRAAAQPA